MSNVWHKLWWHFLSPVRGGGGGEGTEGPGRVALLQLHKCIIRAAAGYALTGISYSCTDFFVYFFAGLQGVATPMLWDVAYL
jgi:hypothetical protein